MMEILQLLKYTFQQDHLSFMEDLVVETEYREMLFQLETEHSDKELYWIIVQ